MNFNPYVPGQKIISFDKNGQEIKNIEDNEDNEDISYTTVNKLHKCISEHEFIEFKKIYNKEYICNDKIKRLIKRNTSRR